MEKQIVTLGAGHGGIDSGAVGVTGLEEKAITLELAVKTAELLGAAGHIDARLLREDDSFLSLPERGRMAARLKSRCHVEIHAGTLEKAEPSVSVVHSIHTPEDAAAAGAMADGIAQALGVRNGGACTRPGFEHPERDFHTVMIMARHGGVAHLLQPEIGVLGSAKTERLLGDSHTVEAVAAAIARAVCGLLGVACPNIRAVPPKADIPMPAAAPRPASAGASTVPPAASAVREEADAVGPKRRPAALPAPGHKPVGTSIPRRTFETVAPGAWFVHAEPAFTSAVLGTVFGGRRFETRPARTGFRRIIFSGRIGYLSPGAFRNAKLPDQAAPNVPGHA